MAQYIDKDALIAEIEKRKSQFMSQADNFHSLGMEEKREHFAVLASNMHSILSFIDTLEVKEVNFDEEFSKYHIGIYNPFNSGAEIYEFAKHFFELGLKAQKGE